MRKQLFLEYKFGDYNMETLIASHANGFIVWMGGITEERIKQLQGTGINIGICIQAFDPHSCPVNPEQQHIMKEKIQTAVHWNPQSIWLDHFRFDGYWETNTTTENLHEPCIYCQGIDRVTFLSEKAKLIKALLPASVTFYYFAVPFFPDERPELVTSLGQDHAKIAESFDGISPMLYHRMIGKPVSYISKYTQWLAKVTQKPIIPILQVKDMPDNLPDGLTVSELQESYGEALKTSPAGIAWFSWDAAVEKNKTGIIQKLFQA